MMRRSPIAIVIVTLLTAAAQARTVLYVDDSSTSGANDGSSWYDAFVYLQDALSEAATNGLIEEIRVARGTYRPDEFAWPAEGTGEREAGFGLLDGVALRGGYAGCGEPDPDLWDVDSNATILSGDLSGNDGPDFAHNNENSYHVLTSTDVGSNAVLDGFTITGGNADGPSQDDYNKGGGMYNYWDSSPRVTNCTFSGNSAYCCGGGMYNKEHSSPTVTNCTFSGNSADWDGGGMRNWDHSSPTVTNCTFSGNSAYYDGGGMCNDRYSSPTVTNCTFSGNSADYGGGMYNSGTSSPTVTNCTFSRNSADVYGGGMYSKEHSSPTITNCTITDNTAERDGGGICCDHSNPTITNCIITNNMAHCRNGRGGGGIFCDHSNPTITNCIITSNTAASRGGGIYCHSNSPTIISCTITGNVSYDGSGIYSDASAHPTMTNSILWNNPACSGIQINVSDGSLVATYSCIQDGWPGDGNIMADPLLTHVGTHLRANSPCRDNGDPTGDYNGQLDIDGEPRVVNDGVDMGADEFLDSDDDGLPNWWEQHCFGSAIAGDPLGDNDGDDLTNLDEYAMSRNPFLAPRTFYVDLAGNDTWDGWVLLWDGQHGPKATIQSAIDAASQYEGDEIVVADGTYTGAGNKNLDFGGKILTVRSANGPTTCIIDCEDDGRAFLFHRHETVTSLVNGFTLTNGWPFGGVCCYWHSSPTITNCAITGNMGYRSGGISCADSSSPTITNCTITGNTVSGDNAYGGGGIYCYGHSSPTITNCTITGNMVSGDCTYGGGICCTASSSPTITNCTITGNTVEGNGYGYGDGGGIYCASSSNPTITNCTIMGNTADANGGGIACHYSAPTITNCTIAGNTACHGSGGGISYWGSNNPTITNCTITGNTVYYSGGGISYWESNNPTITNCTITSNTVNSHYGFGGGIFCSGSASLAITNCILWSNRSCSWNQICSIPSAVVAYSCIQRTWPWPGEGNISDNPRFVDPNGLDGVPGTEDDDLRLSSGSPCIDAGSNGAVPPDTIDLDGDGDTAERTPADLDGYPRFVDDSNSEDTGVPDPPDYVNIVDMGAYEFQAGTQLIESVPGYEESLCRVAGNVIVLTFDGDVTVPDCGDILIQELWADGAYGPDMSTSGFSFTVEDGWPLPYGRGTDWPRRSGPTYRLVITEEGTVLSNKTWIAVRNVGGWGGVESFTVQYMVQVGDVNNDGRVMANDLSPIFPMIPTAGASPTERCDINGDGRVMADDLSPVFPNIPSPSVPKPCGH